MPPFGNGFSGGREGENRMVATIAAAMAGAAGRLHGGAVDLTAGRGELSCALLHSGASRVHAVERSARLLAHLRQTAAGLPILVSSPLDGLPDPAPNVFAILPGHLGTAAVEDTMARASAATETNGLAWIAARTDRGEKGYRKSARRWFGEVEVAGRQGRWRVWKCSHPLVAPGPIPTEVCFEAAGRQLRALNPPGLFSPRRLDRGTALLLEALAGMTRGTAHDAGSGWGPIAMALASLGHQVSASDDDAHAVAATRANLLANGLVGRVDHADGLDHLSGADLNLIATNPPFHLITREDAATTARIIRGAQRALRPGGSFLLVALEILGYERMTAEVFGRTTVVSRARGFAVQLAIA